MPAGEITEPTGGRVTRSLRKRLTSIDTEVISRPGTPNSLQPIQETNTPKKRVTRRASLTNTPSTLTPSKEVTNTPGRRVTRRRSVNISETEDQPVQTISIPTIAVVKEEEPEPESPKEKPKRVLRSSSNSPNDSESKKRNKTPKKALIQEEEEIIILDDSIDGEVLKSAKKNPRVLIKSENLTDHTEKEKSFSTPAKKSPNLSVSEKNSIKKYLVVGTPSNSPNNVSDNSKNKKRSSSVGIESSISSVSKKDSVTELSTPDQLKSDKNSARKSNGAQKDKPQSDVMFEQIEATDKSPLKNTGIEPESLEEKNQSSPARRQSVQNSPAKTTQSLLSSPAKKNQSAKNSPANKNQSAKNSPANKNQSAKNSPANKNQSLLNSPANKNQSVQNSPAKKNHPEPLKNVAFNEEANESIEKNVYPKTPGLVKTKSYILDDSLNDVDKDKTKSKKDQSVEEKENSEHEEETTELNAKTPYKLKLKSVESSTPIQNNSPKQNKTSENSPQKEKSIKESKAKETEEEGVVTFPKSWTKSVSGTVSQASKIDNIVPEKSLQEKQEATNEVLSNSSKNRSKNKSHSHDSDTSEAEDDMLEQDDESDDYDEDEEENERDAEKTVFLDDEAMEVADGEESMDSEERAYLAENEVPEYGESIGSQDSEENDEDDDEPDEEDAEFVVSDNEIVDELLSSEDEVETYNKKKQKKFKRVYQEAQSSDEEEKQSKDDTDFCLLVDSSYEGEVSGKSDTKNNSIKNKSSKQATTLNKSTQNENAEENKTDENKTAETPLKTANVSVVSKKTDIQNNSQESKHLELNTTVSNDSDDDMKGGKSYSPSKDNENEHSSTNSSKKLKLPTSSKRLSKSPRKNSLTTDDSNHEEDVEKPANAETEHKEGKETKLISPTRRGRKSPKVKSKEIIENDTSETDRENNPRKSVTTNTVSDDDFVFSNKKSINETRKSLNVSTTEPTNNSENNEEQENAVARKSLSKARMSLNKSSTGEEIKTNEKENPQSRKSLSLSRKSLGQTSIQEETKPNEEQDKSNSRKSLRGSKNSNVHSSSEEETQPKEEKDNSKSRKSLNLSKKSLHQTSSHEETQSSEEHKSDTRKSLNESRKSIVRASIEEKPETNGEIKKSQSRKSLNVSKKSFDQTTVDEETNSIEEKANSLNETRKSLVKSSIEEDKENPKPRKSLNQSRKSFIRTSTEEETNNNGEQDTIEGTKPSQDEDETSDNPLQISSANSLNSSKKLKKSFNMSSTLQTEISTIESEKHPPIIGDCSDGSGDEEENEEHSDQHKKLETSKRRRSNHQEQKDNNTDSEDTNEGKSSPEVTDNEMENYNDDEDPAKFSDEEIVEANNSVFESSFIKNSSRRKSIAGNESKLDETFQLDPKTSLSSSLHDSLHRSILRKSLNKRKEQIKENSLEEDEENLPSDSEDVNNSSDEEEIDVNQKIVSDKGLSVSLSSIQIKKKKLKDAKAIRNSFTIGLSIRKNSSGDEKSSDNDEVDDKQDSSENDDAFEGDQQQQNKLLNLSEEEVLEKVKDIQRVEPFKYRKSLSSSIVRDSPLVDHHLKQKKRVKRTSLCLQEECASNSFVENLAEEKKKFSEKRKSNSFCCSIVPLAEEDEEKVKLKEPRSEKKLKKSNQSEINLECVQQVLSRCDEMIEAANEEKRKAKLQAKKVKVKKPKWMDKEEEEATNKVEEAEIPLVSKKEIKRKEKMKKELAKALKQSATVLSKAMEHEKKLKQKKSSPNTENGDISSTKRLEAQFLDALVELSNPNKKKHKISETTPPSDKENSRKRSKKNNYHFEDNHRDMDSNFEKFETASGTVVVEPSTPKKLRIQHGFRESPKTPIGFKIEDVNSKRKKMKHCSKLKTASGSFIEEDLTKKQTSRKRKLPIFEDHQYTLPKTQWTTSGFFVEEDLCAYPLTDSKATQFLVAPLSSGSKKRKTAEVISSSTLNKALSFKQNAVKSVRKDTREILHVKHRKNINKKF